MSENAEAGNARVHLMNPEQRKISRGQSRVTRHAPRSALWRRVAAAIGAIGATVALHEAAHAVAAVRGGGRVKEIGVGFGPPLVRIRVRSLPFVVRLFPLGGYAAVDVEQVPPHQRIRMLLAGPLTNIVVGGALVLGLRRYPSVALGEGRGVGFTGFAGTLSALIQAAEKGPGSVGRLTGAINVGLGLMNLLPVYPLDGGHVVLSVMEAHGVSSRARAAFARLTSAVFLLLVQIAMLGDLRRLMTGTREPGTANSGTAHAE